VIDRLVARARSHGRTVGHADPVTHMVRLSGTFAQAQSAFQPEHVAVYDINGRHFMARSGHLSVPPDLVRQVTAVMGFDQRPVAKPHFRIHPRAAAPISYDPAAVAARYEFPADLTGANQTIALIQLGGGYDATQMSAYFVSKNIPRTGSLQAVAVGGASTTPNGDPNGPDGEVQLDIQIAGSVTPGANLAVYFGNNTGSGFVDTVSAAVHDTQRAPSVISISWGGPENQSAAQDIDAMDQICQSAGTLGITVCAASGDDGASDGEASTLVVDFPAASPHVLGCGGTTLPRTGTETGWNDGAQGGASGGGFSAHFPRPDWQSGNTQTGRGVPDVAGNADPRTGTTSW
jgi:kumamolisin